MILLASIIFILLYTLLRRWNAKDRKRTRQTKQSFRCIEQKYEEVRKKQGAEVTLTIQEEWLADNYYLILALHEELLSFLNQSIDKKQKENAYKISYHCLEQLAWKINERNIKDELASMQSEINETELNLLKGCFEFWLLDSLSRAIRDKNVQNIPLYIQSMDQILKMNWCYVTESVSRIHALLLKDPAGIYCNMDEETKSSYRHAVGEIAKNTGIAEDVLSERAIHLSQQASVDKERHVGFYLIDDGVKMLYRQTLSKARIKSTISSNAKIRLYSLLLFVLVHIGSVEIFYFAHLLGITKVWCIPIVILSHIPLYVSLKMTVDHIMGLFLKSRPVPSMKIKSVPPEQKSFIVVPTLLFNKEQAYNMVQKLEMLYYAGDPDNLYFALLGDYADSTGKESKEDNELCKVVLEKIQELNKKHGTHFFYFGRERSYDKINRKYIGWERKRGAILEFVRLLHGEKTSYKFFSADIAKIPKVKYIITVDADTEFLKGCAHKLIAAMMHPLNRPEIDAQSQIVKKGYGLLQPSVKTRMDESEKNLFTHIFSDGGGVDAYSFYDDNFYQKFIGTAIFNGKGIFDVETYWKILNHAIAEQKILSHDLLEGSLLRTGHIKEVVITDGHPGAILSYVKRMHRWKRGDWQLMPYLFPKVYNEDGKKYKNPLTLAAKYQITDNLLRSLLFPSQLLLLLIAACGVKVYGLAVFLLVIWQPLTVLSYTLISNKLSTSTGREKIYQAVSRQFLHFCFLPYFATKTADGIIRALCRTYITHRNMLEWVTAEAAEYHKQKGAFRYFNTMGLQIIFAIIIFFLPIFFSRKLTIWTTVSALLWIYAPLLGCYLERNKTKTEECNAKDRVFLAELAKDTWKYFDKFCGEKENFLPPDNFQERPYRGLAHRTSPTNIGLLLCAYIAAYDFKWISEEEALVRINNTLTTVEKLEKKNGHLYNWYNTSDLSLIKPYFVSTVDSGNFACMLVAVKEAVSKMGGGAKTAERIERLVKSIDFCFLFHKETQRFSIGYDAESQKLSDSCYDLLASEARQAVFFAIARNQVSDKAWYQLSHKLKVINEGSVLLSWTGTMFEYLMPLLFLPSHRYSMLAESYREVLSEQKAHARDAGLPVWGISESAFFAFDNEQNYQYKALGAPKLALRQNANILEVVSPYSSCLALGVDEKCAAKNLKKLQLLGMRGLYGMYESVDFSQSLVDSFKSYDIVRNYMVHHQGMSLVALDNVLHDNIFCKYFLSDMQMLSAKYLLDEPRRT